MPRRIAIIQGHPDASGSHFCNALTDAYAAGARGEGHEVRMIDVARMQFPLIRTREQFRDEPPCEEIREAQETIRWADHLVICYPLWFGSLPALFEGFLEQTFREGFAIEVSTTGSGWKRLLTGRSARVVVTMSMPVVAYRLYFGAHGQKCLKRSILGFAGIGPIRESLIGMVESRGTEYHGRWLIRMQALGRRAH